MNPLVPDLSNAIGAKVIVSSLYDSQDPGFLVQDLLLVEVPGPIYIDISWSPEHDPCGEYVVSVFREHNPIAERKIKSVFDAIAIVERWAIDLSQGLALHANPAVEMHMTPSGSLAPQPRDGSSRPLGVLPE